MLLLKDKRDPEVGVIEVSQVLECKQLYADGVSKREISLRLGISRNTVRRYLRGAIPGIYSLKSPRRRPVRESIKKRVRELLEQERADRTPRKQRLTGARIHRILRGEGHAVSERTVRTVARAVRRSLEDPLERACLPLAYDPGIDAQVDFFEAEVIDDEEGRVKRHVLVVRPCWSRRCYYYVAPNQTREALLEGLIRAFEYFGGVFRNLWFDNLTPAVKRVLRGRTREKQRAFEVFEGYYGFRAQFCAPGKGNEKGGVEHAVKWTKQEGFAPMPRVRGRSGLQAHLDRMAEEERGRTIRGHERSIGEMWEIEQHHLMPLPAQRFDASFARSAQVNNRCWIQQGTNFYSVPARLVGRRVLLKISAEEIVIYDEREEVARHARLYGRYRMSLKLEHYLPLLARKHRGLDRALPVRQWLDQVSECWPRLLAALRASQGEVPGSQDFIEVLQLCPVHGTEAMTAAVEQALSAGTASLPMVRHFLGLRQEEQQEPVTVISWPGPEVHQGPVRAYMEVLHG